MFDLVVQHKTDVCQNGPESSRIYIRHHAQKLNISRGTVERVVTKDLRLHDYKTQLTRQFKVHSPTTSELHRKQKKRRVLYDESTKKYRFSVNNLPKRRTKNPCEKEELNPVGNLEDLPIFKGLKEATRAFSASRRMFGRTWGPKPAMVNWLYTRVIVPIITYSSLVWWHKANQGYAVKLLGKVQMLGHYVGHGLNANACDGAHP
ncbi:hypothetical protein Trydic_g17782 [Trypoxylus dichotomus]